MSIYNTRSKDHFVPVLNVLFRAIAFTIAMVITPVSFAQTQESQIGEVPNSLEEAMQLARQYQAQQGIWEAQKTIADANIAQSKLWENPVVSFDQAGIRSTNEREWSMGIAQPLDVFGKRRTQGKVAELAQSEIGLRQQIYQTELDLVVKQLWSQMAISAAEAEIIDQQLQISQQTLVAADKRYRAGAIAQVDADRIRMTVLQDQRQAQNVLLQLQQAQQQLSQVWGKRETQLNPSFDISQMFPKWSEQDALSSLANNWQEKRLQLSNAKLHSELALIKAQGRPNPTISVGMTRSQGAQEEQVNNTQFNVGFSVPLNIFDRQQYKKAINQAKATGLNQQYQVYQQQTRLDIERTLDQLEGLKQQFDQINVVQVPLAEQVQRKTLQGFEAGKFSVMEVQQASLQLRQISLQKIEVLREAWTKLIDLESLSVGISPETIRSPDAIRQINESLWSDTQNIGVIGN